MKRFPMLLGFATVTLAGSLALAHGGRGHGGFGKADTNNDGKVTLAEAQAHAKLRFQKKDANKDGVITADEVAGRMKFFIEKADANKDGKVTLAEHEAMVKAFFEKRDVNKDGVLSGDELRRPDGKHNEKRGGNKA